MFKWLARNKVMPISVFPGDTVTATVETGHRTESVTTQITKPHTITDIAIGEFENELGFKDGVVGVFGRK
jgi:hypothetical protein